MIAMNSTPLHILAVLLRAAAHVVRRYFRVINRGYLQRDHLWEDPAHRNPQDHR